MSVISRYRFQPLVNLYTACRFIGIWYIDSSWLQRRYGFTKLFISTFPDIILLSASFFTASIIYFRLHTVSCFTEFWKQKDDI